MLKKVVLGSIGLVLVLCLGLFFWVRSVLASDQVKAAIASQISETLGQPVAIGSVSATIYPRIGVAFNAIRIGTGTSIEVQSLKVETDLRALLSRRIEHATLNLTGVRILLPLPPFALPNSTPTTENGSSPVELVSIDSIILRDVDIVSGGHTIRGHVEVVPQGRGVVIKNVTLTARDMTLTATGNITDLSGPTGSIAIKAGALDFDQLLALANDFATASGLTPPAAPAPAVGSGVPAGLPLPASASASVVTTPSANSMNLTVSIEAEKATMSGLTIEKVTGQAIANDDMVSLSPLTFNVFGGRYDGKVSVTLRTAQPTFHWIANLSNVDVAKATAYAGSPNTATGTLTAKVDLAGSGTNAAMAMKTARGIVRLDVVNGVVRNLGLVRSVGMATTLSIEGLQRAAASATDVDEPFRRLGGTISVADGLAQTNDLQFEAADLSMTANGTMRLDGSAINLRAQLQLSDGLSREVNSKMLRLSQQEGRVTLAAMISGTAAQPSVKVDGTAMTKRALQNTAKDEAPKLLQRGIGKLFPR